MLILSQDSENLQLRSQDLQQRLRSKEQDLEQLFQKQRRVSTTNEPAESDKIL